jgi:hypothetical protein
MYPDDYNGGIPPNKSTTVPDAEAWIAGKLTWDTGDPSYPDNVNQSFVTDPKYALLAPYSNRSAGIYKCPGDKVDCNLGPRVRSYSMNNMMNGVAAVSYMNQKPYLQYRIYRKQNDITVPSPSLAWVFIDEHADSINDGFFWVDMFGNKWRDLPASYHCGSGALSFADGHAEIRKWSDKEVRDRPVRKGGYNNVTGTTGAEDLTWLQSCTTAPK